MRVAKKTKTETMKRPGRRATAAPYPPRKQSAAVSVTATEAKNRFSGLLERAIAGGAVIITRHDAPKAVLISVDEYETLSRAGESRLDTLRGQFDALLARMQTPEARGGMRAAFNASPEQLGRTAVAAIRRRG